MKKSSLMVLAFVAVVAIVAPFLAGAQSLPSPVAPPTTEGPIKGGVQAIDLLNTFLGWLAVIFWIAAAGFIFYAAFLYLTAAGDPEKVKKASHSLLYGVIAIAVGLMAYGLPAFVQNVIGGK